MPLATYEQSRLEITADIAARTAEHQATIARIKSAEGHAHLLGLDLRPQRPLTALAHGDSWFDYPLNGNSVLTLDHTDIIAQLQHMGDPSPVILNVSHYGDATTDELAFPKQQRMADALADGANWFDGKPDAILFSGGGNDIVGEKFCIYLDFAGSASGGLNAERFDLALGAVERGT